jgi:hypothetical protein
MPILPNQARLIFRVSTPDDDILRKLTARLETDFSPIVQSIPPAGAGERSTWLLTRDPVYVEEFPSFTSYTPKLEQLFSTDANQTTIAAAYITRDRIVIATSPDDPHGIFIGSCSYAKTLAIRPDATGEFQPVITNLGVRDQLLKMASNLFT